MVRALRRTSTKSRKLNLGIFSQTDDIRPVNGPLITGKTENAFARKLYELRRKLGWSQQLLASKAAVTQPMICRAENGEIIPDRAKVKQLDDAMNANRELEATLDAMLSEKPALRMGIPNSILAGPIILIAWGVFPHFSLRATHFVSANNPCHSIAQAPNIVTFDSKVHQPYENASLIEALRNGVIDCAWVARSNYVRLGRDLARLAVLSISALPCDWMIIGPLGRSYAVESLSELWSSADCIAFLTGSLGEDEYHRVRGGIARCPSPIAERSFGGLKQKLLNALNENKSVLCLATDPLTSFLESEFADRAHCEKVVVVPELYEREALPGLGTTAFDLVALHSSMNLDPDKTMAKRIAAIVRNVQEEVESMGSIETLERISKCLNLRIERVRSRLANAREHFEVTVTPYLLSILWTP